MPDPILKKLQDDATADTILQEMASSLQGKSARRPVVLLLLNNPATLRRYQLSDFSPEVNSALEVYPFTRESAWAEKMLLPGLDRQPIGPESKQRVHLVLAGWDSYAQALAIQTALVAHYPNYSEKAAHPIRTRITVIQPGLDQERDSFIARYHQLFQNSFYRFVNLDGKCSTLHHPQYHGKREEFVDVEWEFVEGSLSHPVVVEKLSLWAKDAAQQLTLAISGPQDTANLDAAMALPDALLEADIPVWVRMSKDLTGSLGEAPRFKNLIPFGMEEEELAPDLSVLQMARLVNYFYSCGDNFPTTFPEDQVDAAWQKVGPYRKRLSNICNVLTMATKMRSLGHTQEDLSTFYALTDTETTSLSRTEHNRWSVDRLVMGARPCTDEELAALRKDVGLRSQYKQKEVHPDLCAYDQLGVDEHGKDVRVYDYQLTACIPLIVKTCLGQKR